MHQLFTESALIKGFPTSVYEEIGLVLFSEFYPLCLTVKQRRWPGRVRERAGRAAGTARHGQRFLVGQYCICVCRWAA